MVYRASMQEYHKGRIIVAGATNPAGKSKWRPSCRISDEGSGKFLKELDGYSDCNTREEAEMAGLVIGEKWIDNADTKFR